MPPSPDRISFGSTEARPYYRVLVADDDDDFRALIASVLRRRGFLVATVRDGYEFADFIAATSVDRSDLPDAVVSDVRMPGYDGLQLLSRVRAAGWPTPVILVSGFADRELNDRAGDEAFAVFAKPCAMDDIADAVEEAVGIEEEE